MTKYALKNGIYHMTECGLNGKNVDFSWATDVKIVFAILMMKSFRVLRNRWREIVQKRQTFLSEYLLEELLFHMRIVAFYVFSLP